MRTVALGNRQYVGVTRDRRCPICGKPDWCLISVDGMWAVCERIHDGGERRYMNAGTLHKISNAPSLPQRMPSRVERSAPRETRDWHAVQAEAEAARDMYAAKMLAQSLGVSSKSLIRFGLGRIGRDWSFPMFDARRRVCGIRLRTPSGRKFAVKGSRAGVFVPRGGLRSSSLLICEGTTDAAAMLDAGFDAIGRHACRGQIEIITEYAAGRDVVIVADAGKPGQDGADELAQSLCESCKRVRIFTPPYAKDARAWWRLIKSPAMVRHSIDAAAVSIISDGQRHTVAEVLAGIKGHGI